MAHLTKIVESSLRQVLLATARVYVEGPNGVRVLARALIDQCSQVSLISRSLCQRLRLNNKSVHVPICGVGSYTAAVSSESVSFTIRPRFKSNFSCQVQALVLPSISSYTPPTLHMPCELTYLNGLELADSNFMDKGHIDLLLGASIHSRIIKGRVIRGRENEPIASLASLGWLISGKVLGSKVDSNLFRFRFTVLKLDLSTKFFRDFGPSRNSLQKSLHS